jgi:hypothetical protein
MYGNNDGTGNPALERYATKATLARLLGVDMRSRVIKRKTPVAQLIAGKKTMPLYLVEEPE